jgi:hypothetical protein
MAVNDSINVVPQVKFSGNTKGIPRDNLFRTPERIKKQPQKRVDGTDYMETQDDSEKHKQRFIAYLVLIFHPVLLTQ